MSSTVQIFGDSTLDPLFWYIDKEGSNAAAAAEATVEARLRNSLGAEYTVFNHAYDGFTTEDVLGMRSLPVGSVLPSREKNFTEYLKQRGGRRVVRPLEDVRKNLPAEGTHYVLISVGGNDFRENLLNPIRLIKDISKVQGRYLQIVDQVKNMSTEGRKVCPILMFQYRTDANHDHYFIYSLFGAMGAAAFVVNLICVGLILAPAFQAMGGILILKVSTVVYPIIGLGGLFLSNKAVPLSVSKDIVLLRKPSMSLFGAIIKKFYQPILKEAREFNIPVLDLPNTFNPYDDLYISGIEPSEKGSALIAEGIAHIVRNHDFSGASMLYAKTGDSYEGSPNTQNWSVAYPKV